jgi:riboflavin synthase
MFTGIVSDMGKLRKIEKRGDTHLTIETHYDIDAVAMGASIACAGICLTVVGKGAGDDGWFDTVASAETVSKTTMGAWKPGDLVNLEKPLRVGDEFGGHIVTGHVDGVAEVLSIAPEGESLRFVFKAPAHLAKFIASKGSVALDGVSLTVNETEGAKFGVNIIPHTAEVTTFGVLKPGSRVNLEIDPLARYLERLMKG